MCQFIKNKIFFFIIIIIEIISLSGYSAPKCSNIFLTDKSNKLKPINENALATYHGDYVLEFESNSAKNSESPKLFFNKTAKAPPSLKIPSFYSESRFRTFQPNTKEVIDRASQIAQLAGLGIPEKLYIYLTNGLGGMHISGLSTITLVDSSIINYIYLVAHEYGHSIFENSLRKMLPEPSRTKFEIYLKNNSDRYLNEQSFNSKIDNDWKFFNRFNEMFADLVAILTLGKITDKSNIEEITGIHGDIVAGLNFSDNRTFSSAELINFSYLDQHGVMAHMRAWLGLHRLKVGMTDSEKAKLLRNVMLTNVALVDEYYTHLSRNIPVPSLVSTHQQLIEANLKYLETFLRIERENAD